MQRVNPFAPNSPVNRGMFVGRIAELVRLETSLIQAHDYLAPRWAAPDSAATQRLLGDYEIICAHLSHLGWARVTAGEQSYEVDGLADSVLEVFRAFHGALKEQDEGQAGWFESAITIAVVLLDRRRLRDPMVGLATTTTTVSFTTSSCDDPVLLAELREARRQ